MAEAAQLTGISHSSVKRYRNYLRASLAGAD
jgi:hypothetical protein